jgi:hypothetical protein
LIVSCMEQFGHYSDKLVNCLNDNSLSNPWLLLPLSDFINILDILLF